MFCCITLKLRPFPYEQGTGVQTIFPSLPRLQRSQVLPNKTPGVEVSVQAAWVSVIEGRGPKTEVPQKAQDSRVSFKIFSIQLSYHDLEPRGNPLTAPSVDLSAPRVRKCAFFPGPPIKRTGACYSRPTPWLASSDKRKTISPPPPHKALRGSPLPPPNRKGSKPKEHYE